MAKRKFDKRDIQSVLKGFVDATYQEHGSHSFAAGYFESMLASILADSPRCKQVEAMDSKQTLQRKGLLLDPLSEMCYNRDINRNKEQI